MGPPGNRGSWGPCVLAHTQAHPPKKAYKKSFLINNNQHCPVTEQGIANATSNMYSTLMEQTGAD
ncbi:unnamed protein product [Staurois parvus]|uniref:Uncharacterized protein n=1 Tax=Staurois parvus TaxID=386267 RepID=A0ABN9GQ11_9NEOB|nr:unnamed protein product [Staurois parvus]